ncbi:hypothetical protein ACFOET_02845 [Parapedobacter deserti]|uniref:DUF4840 domain-containing protein n=1 Tax=Parapedobacter deserti TaxID=1912957 RepID=A0ABV7JI58_9SPHI
MKKFSLFRTLAASLCIMTAFVSCRNEYRDNDSEQTPGNVAGEITEDMGALLPALPYIAAFDETSERLIAEKNPDFDRALLTADDLAQALMTNYPEITIEVDSVSNNTLHLQIPDARYLTQQMGSSGAQMYLLEATYAFTELPGISSVNFRFEEGDHALPGTYTRERFKERSIAH